MAKPNPAFFRMALEAGGAEPHEALMVGDSYRADVRGAWAAGMDAVWLDRHEGININPDDEPIPTDVRRIRSLDELPEIVGSGGPLPRGRLAEPASAPDRLKATRVARGRVEVVVDKFGGSVLRRPEDIAAAVAVVERQRAVGLRPVVVVSAFEGVTDTILGAARVLLPDEAGWLREPSHDAGLGDGP